MTKHHEFEQQVKTMLDQSVDELTPEIQRRLQSARYAALDKARARPRWWGLPAAAMAMALVAVVTTNVLLSQRNAGLPETVLAMDSEMELLTSADNLELMEDLEFMQWLAESQTNAS